MTFLLGLIGGPLGKWLGYAAAVAAVIGAAAWYVHSREVQAVQAFQAAQQAAIAEVRAEMQKQADAAVQAAVDAERTRSAQDVQVREVIRRVPVTIGCIGSPAERAMLDRVRATAGGGGGSAGASGAAVLPAGAAHP